MAPTDSSIFREHALKHYIQQRAKDILPQWQAPHKNAIRLKRRKVPLILQMSAIECGSACLAMILSYYGRKVNVSEINERCGLGRDGLTALNLVRVARSYELRVRAISLQENDFRCVHLPAIIHWEFNHYLIVERWTPQRVDIVDPASGRKQLTAKEFEDGFTGVVIILEPGIHFTRQSDTSELFLRTYLAHLLKQSPLLLVQIIGASLILQVFGLGVPILTKVVVDQILPFKMSNILTILGIGIFLLFLMQWGIMLLRTSMLIYLKNRIDTHLMTGCFEHLLRLPQTFFQRHTSGDVLSRLSSNTVIRDLLSNRLISTVLDGSLVVIYLLILLSQSLFFGILALLFGIFQVTLLLCTNQPARRLASQELEATGRTQGYTAEVLNGITTLKAAGAEQRAFQHWANLYFDQLNVTRRRNYFSSFIDTTMTSLRTLSPLLLLLIGTMQVLQGTMALGTMLALNALAVAFLSPLASLVSTGQQVQFVRSHLLRIADVMKTRPEQDVRQVQQPPRLKGYISLEQVSFQYDPNSPQVLQDIQVSIEPGQRVAIVGRTGSGKSTLGKLLLGLYLPTEGTISYDDIALSDLNYQEVRGQFGVVMQESTIFSGTIRENISFNDPEMHLEQIIRAAQIAGLDEDIEQMSMKYETFVSEGGSVLSGGQRQRLAIARAVAHVPSILLLDEATSSLDVATERIVEQNLSRLACTQIIIAHRLSTVRNADIILVLEKGVIVERGSHQELLMRNGYYAELVRNQLSSDRLSISHTGKLM